MVLCNFKGHTLDTRGRHCLRRLFCSLAGLLLLGFPALGEEDRDLPRERNEWNLRLRVDSSGRVLSENRRRALREASRIPVDPSMKSPGAGILSASEAPAAWQALGPQPIRSKVG